MSQALQKAHEGGHLTLNPIKLRQGWVLQKLTEKHKTIIALHAQGVSRVDIGAVAGCTPEYVSMIVAQPLAKQYLSEIEVYMESRMQALYAKSVDAVADALDSGDMDVRLKAARLQLEATGKMKGDKKDTRSAEDIVASILEKASTIVVAQNVQVNQTGG